MTSSRNRTNFLSERGVELVAKQGEKATVYEHRRRVRIPFGVNDSGHLSAIVAGAFSLSYVLLGTILVQASGAASYGGLRGVSAMIAGVVVVAVQFAASRMRRQHPINSYLLIMIATTILMLLLQNRAVAMSPIYWFSVVSLAAHMRGLALMVTIGAGMLIDVTGQIWLMTRTIPAKIDLGNLGVSDAAMIMGGAVLNVFVSYAVCIAVGRVAAAYRNRIRRLNAHLQHLDTERERLAREAVATERTRMARELHDVTAHHLTGLLVQSQAAKRIYDTDPETVRLLLDGITKQAKKSLDSMRQIVGILRIDTSSEVIPRPVIADIPGLVNDSRPALLWINLCMASEFADAEDAVQLSTYRIVQESLSNAIKHSPGSMVDISLRREGPILEIVVENTASVITAHDSSHGFGLIGMRERAELLGGRLAAGPTADGGWRVEAVLMNGSDFLL